MKEKGAYILGTEIEELNRLGIQHQIWAEEAQKGWRKAGFSEGDVILDLGSGPGFCSRELAYLTANSGKVIAIDKSKSYIDFLDNLAQSHSLNIEAICSDFNSMKLQDSSIDGMYCRWAMAWISNPKEILSKVYKALKPGGKMVIHEYYDWTTHQTEPSLPNLKHAIKQCYASFKEQEGDIDVGRNIPLILEDLGMKIKGTRPMAKIAKPNEAAWNWPKSFYQIYFPKLVEMGYLSDEECELALKDHQDLEKNPNTTLLCPMLIEVIAQK